MISRPVGIQITGVTILEKNTKVFTSKRYYKLRKKLSKTDILVFRKCENGRIKNSRPCSECLETMKKLGIRRVYYSSDDGSIICEKVSTMVSLHKTKMTRSIERGFKV
jgi:hypothetical protein